MTDNDTAQAPTDASPKRIPSFLRNVGKWVLTPLAVLALGTSIGTLAWVRAEPRSIDNYLPAILSQVNAAQEDATVAIDHAQLAWKSWDKPLMISAQNIQVHTRGSNPALLAKLPSAVVGIDIWRVLWGRFRLRWLEAENPEIHLYPLLSMGQSRVNPDSRNTPLIHSDLLNRLKFVRVRDAKILLPESIPQSTHAVANISLAKENGKILASMQAAITHDEHTENDSEFFIQASAPRRSRVYEVNGYLKNFLLDEFIHLPGFPKELEKLSAPIDAQWSGQLMPDAAVLEGTLQLEKGVIIAPKMFENPVSIKSFQAAWQWDSRTDEVALKEGVLAFPEVDLNFKLATTLNPQKRQLFVDANLGTLSIPKLKEYWPLILAPMTREWAMESILSGTVAKADLKMRLLPEDFAAENFSDKAVDSTIELQNAQLRYLPTHPIVTNMDATLRFTGTTMGVKVHKASTQTGTHVSSGSLVIPDLNAADTRLKADLNVKTVAADVARFLALPELNGIAKRLNLTPETVNGTATGNVKFDALVFTSDPNPTPELFADEFFYDIDGDLKQVSVVKMMGDKDIHNANLHLSFNNTLLKVSGDTVLNGAQTKLTLIQDAKKDTESIDADMHMNAVNLKRFGLDTKGMLTGPLRMEVHSTKQADTPEKMHLALTLDETRVNAAPFSLYKAPKVPMSLAFNYEKNADGKDVLTDIELKSKEGVSRGRLTYDSGTDTLESLSLLPLKAGKHDCDVEYNIHRSIPTLNIKGRALDISGLVAEDEQKDSKSAEQKAADKAAKTPEADEFGAMQVKLALNKLYMNMDYPFQNVNAKMFCSKIHCSKALATGQTSSKNKFKVEIFNQKTGRQFLLKADNAGEFIRATNFMDNLEGGTLNVDGQYIDDVKKPYLDAVLRINDLRVTDAPLLTKIISLTSPVGFVETLTGQGVSLTRIKMPFTYARKVITLNKASAKGPSLGFNVDGKIDMHHGEVDLEGTVIPAYVFNSAVGKIPVIGEVLSGGENEGLIATRFSAKGEYPDPEISVNPLSMLTPGFLRGIFDIFDAPEEKPETGDSASAPIEGEEETPTNAAEKSDKEAPVAPTPATPKSRSGPALSAPSQ